MRFIQSQLIAVRRIKNRGKGGRGVFARVNILKNQIIERAPCLIIPDKQIPNDEKLTLSWYAFDWHKKVNGKRMACIALGYISLYNHSYSPSAAYDMEGKDIMTIRAIRDIKKGEEITVNYNGNPKNQTEVGFEVN